MPSWTPEQTLAIERIGCDLLVSASAGTGKTAVLVERIVRLVLDKKNPTDLDRFLVVTFTEAAASEMREKIAAALRERLAESSAQAVALRGAPHPPREVGSSGVLAASDRLRRQVLLLDQARISTIHSFCHNLLRQHFHRLGLDPEFAILDEQEMRLLRSETAEALFEQEFDRADPAFLRWLDAFGGADPEIRARSRVLRLNCFLESLPDAPAWIERVRRSYPVAPDGSGVARPFEEHEWLSEWREGLGASLGELTAALESAAEEARDVEAKYLQWISSIRSRIAECADALENAEWATAIEGLQGFQFGRMPASGDKSQARERLKARLDDLRERFRKEIQGNLAAMTPDQAARAHAAAAPAVRVMLDLVERFRVLYAEAKRARAVLDFSDLEQLCLRLLRDENDPRRPSDVARLCQDQFEHVLVDEYQDINPVQEAILALVSRQQAPERPNNLFAVGDAKQSIYAFRLAAPEIFLQKLDAFPRALGPSPGSGSRARVDLNRNFRSRIGILSAVNCLFERIMTRESAGLDYDEAAALKPGASYPPPSAETADPLPVEVHVLESRMPAETGDASEEDEADDASADETSLDDGSLADWETIEREALLVGRRIRQMVGRRGDGSDAEFAVLSTDAAAPDREPIMRPVTYRDIVVLLRSVRNRADAFASVLERLGAPVFADPGTGYFSASEVRDALNLLRLIDNPLQDIPLAATLRSPLENWTDTELALVRKAYPEGCFHEALRAAARTGDGVGLKAAEFLQRLDRWRTRARREPLADLIAAIYDATACVAYVSGLPGGGVRRGNLQRLYSLACQFDQFSRQGLARFLRFMNQLEREEGDFGAASPMAENENAVRVMSIHKSKGLEFPVVFLANLGARFNLDDARSSLILSRRAGIGVEVTDLERAVRYPTPALKVLRRVAQRDALAEEMRILYVAMTRARERLVLTGSVRDLGRRLRSWWETGRERKAEGPRDCRHVLTAGTPLDWIAPTLARRPDAGAEMARALGETYTPSPEAEGGGARFALMVYPGETVATWRAEADGARPEATHDGEDQVLSDASGSTEARVEACLRRMSWSYPHAALSRCPARVSVSELKRRFDAGDEVGERSYNLVLPSNGPTREESRDGARMGEAEKRPPRDPVTNRLGRFFDRARKKSPGRGENVEYRPVDDAEAHRIRRDAGLDVSGYTHMIDRSGLRHILASHGEGAETRAGHLPIAKEDILMLPKITADCDSIEALVTKQGLAAIRYKKRIDGYVFYVEEVRTGKKRLAAKTMWKLAAGAPGATARGQASRCTSETFPGKPAPMLPESLAEVNEKSLFQTPALEGKPNAVERGAWTHLVLQHLDLLRPLDYAGVSAQIDGMIDRGVLTERGREAVDIRALERFFASPLGRRLLAVPADRVWRETPFVLGLTPSEVKDLGAGLRVMDANSGEERAEGIKAAASPWEIGPGSGAAERSGARPHLPADPFSDLERYDPDERIRVQGVIDCLIEEADGLLLIDFKTDAIPLEAVAQRAALYLPQVRLYAKAVDVIFPAPLKEIYLYFLAPGRAEPILPRDAPNRSP
jgi:ATP-dependent helicase/nuclease subunit A